MPNSSLHVTPGHPGSSPQSFGGFGRLTPGEYDLALAIPFAASRRRPSLDADNDTWLEEQEVPDAAPPQNLPQGSRSVRPGGVDPNLDV
mmetsp:Transcript_94151/g.180981  ORF Transcript_94151/g.180981 Transcript_94151/m.180981 type:complete len:89 (-) Transcript_94151:149-415(-)